MIAWPDTPQRRALWFTGLLLGSCFALQRFGIPFGSKQLSIVGPVGWAIALWGLATGTVAFHRGRLVVFLLLLSCVLLGLAFHAALPGGAGSGLNVSSLAQFLLLTAFATLTFTEAVEEHAFFSLVTLLLVLVCVAGIGQFAAQFVGLRLFAFTGLLPDWMLFESTYNVAIPIGIGDFMKSNGFVLVEPSVFSQLMAIGLIIEALALRRLAFLGLFTAGLLLSFSGTGWIVLGAFVVGSAIGMGWRGLLIALGMTVLLMVALGFAALVAPDFAGALVGRVSEVSQPGTSGHLRFVTPFWMLHDVMSANPTAFLLGIGVGGSESLPLPYEYDVNTPVKIVVEYGVPALFAYVLLFVVGQKTRIQLALVFPAVLLFMFTGGYQQFPPMVFFILLLTSVARLRHSAQPNKATSDTRIGHARHSPSRRSDTAGPSVPRSRPNSAQSRPVAEPPPHMPPRNGGWSPGGPSPR